MKNHKTALITGASSGIGHELTKLFAKNNYNLVLVANDKGRLEKLATELSQEFNISILAIPKDLTIETSPREIYDELTKKSIKIDILVNNAGFSVYGLFASTDLQRELQMIQLNIISLTALTKLFLPEMIAKASGKILNVGSTGSFAPGPLNAVYCATKAYVLSFSEALAEELKGTGITITTLCPGATKTEFAQRAKIEDIKLFKGNTMDPKKVAEIGYSALMREKTMVVAGCANKLTIFSLRFIPRSVTAKISKSLMSRS